MEAQVKSLDGALDREWYHTLELAPGVVTPGWFDTREVVRELPFPGSLAGMRCLDVATFDGFWAYEMERRGASETIGIDILDPMAWDWPLDSTSAVIDALEQRKEGGRGFEIARQALDSSVERIEMSVYDLDPKTIGEFDFVYVGSLLMHLRDPVRALESVRSVCRGRMLLVDNINLGLTLAHPRRPVAALDGVGRPWWWKMNLPGLARAVQAGGFRLVQPPKRIWMPPGRGHPRARLSRQILRSEEAREFLVASLKGDPHAAILAEPAHEGGMASGSSAPELHEIKKRVIDVAFGRADTRSFADLGGVWAVDAGYTFYALERHRPGRAVLVDEDITSPVRARAGRHANLNLLERNFGEIDPAAELGSVDAVFMFDVLLHQVAPNWDELLGRYAEVTRDFLIVNPQFVESETSVRLLELGRERYTELVPQQANEEQIWERFNDFDKSRGRLFRDVHNIWQWGIVDEDLRVRMEALGFELVYFENAGQWRDLPAFENHAFVFTRA